MSGSAADPLFEGDLGLSYLTGVYLALNAVPDACLVVDGPNCAFFRTAQIQGNHDFLADLVSADGLHRIADTDATPDRLAAGDEGLLRSRLVAMSGLDRCQVVLLCAMSLVEVTGRQYDAILGELADELGAPVIQVPAGSLAGDWLHGYEQTLASLARELALDKGPRDPDEVAIVGHLFHRNEADQQADVQELGRLLEALGLCPGACWLGGQPVSALARVGRAGTILSFPYGREAARILAERTGARLVSCALPLGLQATTAWLRQVAEALGRQARAEALREAELRRVVPRLEWILPHLLQGRQLLVVGDPVLARAVAGAAVELGCGVGLEVHTAASTGSDRPTPVGHEVLVKPTRSALHAAVSRLRAAGGLDLAVVSSLGLPVLAEPAGAMPVVELGFPSYHTHFLYPAPCLGFAGTLHLVSRLANAIGQRDILGHRPRED